MQFLRTLRERIRQGEITSTVRLWQRPHVKVGGRVFLVEFRYRPPNRKS